MKVITICNIILPTIVVLVGCSSLKKDQPTEIGSTNHKEFVPDWAKSVVWYQIFPERFRDGDSTNNPTIGDIKFADPQELAQQWNIHPWGSDWYELQPYELQNGEPELWKHLLRRRYGGDLQGIIDKLGYLEELGITAIYLNPVFDSPSLHKYDGESYHHIDPNFGPDPLGDRKLMESENPIDPGTWVWTKADELALELIDKAHERGMKIIFDGVFNHLGINSFAFQDVIKNQQRSPYANWFIINSWDNPEAGTKFDYEGWFGVKSLPELREDSLGIVKGPKDYIFNATKRWMNPKNKGIEYGIDGWRLDVAFCIAHPFWKSWREHVKSINPNAYLTAEIVDRPDNVKPYMEGDEFDGEMNYNFAFTCAEFFFNPDSTRISATKFDKKLEKLRKIYPQGVAEVSQNLFGSHDANRIGSHIVNRGIGNFRDWGNYFNLSKSENSNYKVSKPNTEDLQLQKLFVIMQMTYTGAPMIYYGDEVGMWGANDPDCRKPMLWSDITYDDEVTNPDGTQRVPDKVEINKDLFNHYKKLIDIRNKNEVLKVGSYKTLVADDSLDVFVFGRGHEESQVIIALNNSQENRVINIPDIHSECYLDLLSNSKFSTNTKNLEVSIEGRWGAILKPCN